MALTAKPDPALDVAVLYGGVGCEREISLVSGAAVLQGLLEAGWKARGVDVTGDDRQIRELTCDAAFIVLHGRYGEDGTVQTLLEEAGIPFTGSGPAASALCMNKHQTKVRLVRSALPTAWWMLVDDPRRVHEAMAEADMRLPVVVKPVSGGSSVGTTIVRDEAGLEPAVALALEDDETAMLEEFVAGREMTVGMLDGIALPVVEMATSRTFYDYQAKYHDDGTQYLCPAPLDANLTEYVQDVAMRAVDALGIEHFARVDIIYGPDGPMILEANTVPGFTSHSLLPMAARAAGLEFPALCSRILELALQRARVS